MQKYLGIDYGLARVGVAVSDALGITARGLESIYWRGKDMQVPVQRIAELAKLHGVGGIVFGLPKRTDGKESPSESNARLMGELVEAQTGLPVIYRDERYTTVIAQQILQNSMVKKQNKRQVVDQVAAEIILRDFLESLR